MKFWPESFETDLVLALAEKAENGEIALVDAADCARKAPGAPMDFTPLDVLLLVAISGNIEVNTKEGKVIVK